MGTTAWAVFLNVCLDGAEDRRGRLEARASARSVAADLGISKDTAARSLARLVDAGHLSRVGQPRARRGRFHPGVYRIRRRVGLEVTPCPTPAVTGTARRPDRMSDTPATKPARTAREDDQLGLFHPPSADLEERT